MNKSNKRRKIHGNRNYKDSLFRMVFKEKKDLLDLYNAINNTHYTNADDLEINTLENVLYMGMKNDISFLIGCQMNLYEHQSTQNENMPLRGFLYLAKLFETYLSNKKVNLYTKRLQKIPTPQYIVFYNGKDSEPDTRIQRLSDAFIKPGGCLECEVRLLNINYGHNKELMEKCQQLKEYSIFIATVRNYINQDLPLKPAITAAMEECIRNGILLDLLTTQKAEVFGMVLSAFDQEQYEKDLKEEAFYDGFHSGIAKGLEKGLEKGGYEKICQLIRSKHSKGQSVEEIAEALEESPETVCKIMKQLGLS